MKNLILLMSLLLNSPFSFSQESKPIDLYSQVGEKNEAKEETAETNESEDESDSTGKVEMESEAVSETDNISTQNPIEKSGDENSQVESEENKNEKLKVAEIMTELPCLVTLRTSYAYTLDREKTKVGRGQVLTYRLSQKYKNAVAVDFEGTELYMLKKYVEFPDQLVCPVSRSCAEVKEDSESFVFRKSGPRPAGKLKGRSLYPIKAYTQGTSINPIVALEVTPKNYRWVSKNQIRVLEKTCDQVVEERQTQLLEKEKVKIKVMKAELEKENQKKIEEVRAEEEEKRKQLEMKKRRINFSFSAGATGDVNSRFFDNTITPVSDEDDVGPEPNPIVREIAKGEGWFSQACLDYDLLGRLLARTRLRVRGCGRYESFEVKIKGKDNPDPNPPAGTNIDDLADIEEVYSVSNLALDSSIFTHTDIGSHSIVLGIVGVRAQYYLSDPVQFRYLTGNIFKNTEVFLETGPEGFDQKFYSYVEYHYNLKRFFESIRIGAEFTYDQQMSFYLGFAF